MNITAYAIQNYRFTQALLVLIFLSAIFSYIDMPRAEDPEFSIRNARITTFLPGASPSRMEELITDKLEKRIEEIPELDFIQSDSKTGVSIIVVKIKDSYTNLRPIWDNLRRKVADAADELPSGVTGPIVNDEFGDVYGQVFTITGEGFNYSELKDVADEVRDELLRLKDVAKVDILGAQDERIFLEYNNARLAEIGISPGQLANILSSTNIINPGGAISTEAERIALEPSGNYESLNDLGKTIINIPGKQGLIYLSDLVNISRGYIDPPQIRVRSSGIPALALSVSMQPEGNILALGEQTQQILQQMQERYPIGIEFDTIAFQPERVKLLVDSFIGSLLQAVAVVTLVMLFFLGLRTGLIVATLVPSSILSCFLLMNYFHIGLNQVSLTALIISLGMLVDNAIVMVEAIMVQMREGKRLYNACIDVAGELRIPLLTSSLTTSAAFLPQFLAESTTGEYTEALFQVVSITLLSSWLLSLTMIPMLCMIFLKLEKNNDNSTDDNIYDSQFYQYYRRFLSTLLRNRTLTLFMVGVVFIISLKGFGLLPKIFFPPADRTIITAELELPTGSSIERTAEVVSDVEDYIRQNLLVDDDNQGITNWGSFIGNGGTRFVINWSPNAPTDEYAFLLINTSSTSVIDSVIEDIEEYVFNKHPDVIATLKRTSNGPPVRVPVAIRIIGKDVDTLFALEQQVRNYLDSVEGTKNVDNNWGNWTKKLFVEIDQAKARRAQITSQDIAISLQASFSGIETTQFRDGDKLVPITLRSVEADRQDLAKVESINVYAQNSGNSVPLKQVANVYVKWQPSKILRRNRYKTITVESELEPGVTANEIVQVITPWLTEQSKSWPLGYRYELGGEAYESGKASESIRDKMPIGGLVILILLIWQFNSIRKPIIILITIPLSLIGVVAGLLLTQSYFGIMTFLGVISLAGIVINNAIVLLDRITTEIDEFKRTPFDAIIEASQRRLRPILLTTATTVVGLIPLWVSGNLMFQPMAIAIIFGLLFSTILTLGLVPILYSLFFKVKTG